MLLARGRVWSAAWASVWNACGDSGLLYLSLAGDERTVGGIEALTCGVRA